MNDFDVLEQFGTRWPADPAKRDLELACLVCGDTICAVEAGDNFAMLANAADNHWLTADHPAVSPGQ